MINASNNDNITIDINATNGFITKVKKHQKNLTKTQIPTKEMQTQYHNLWSCKADLGLLIEDINTHKKEQCHDLCQWKLKKSYLGYESEKLHDIAFESWVVKNQNGALRDLTVFENNACAALKLQDGISENNGNTNAESITYKEYRVHYQNKNKKCDTGYSNLDCIMGSVAVVE